MGRNSTYKKPDNYLVISDLQIPFEAPNALKFCKRLQKEFKIPQHNIICVGDELDQYWGSDYAKDPDATHTANQEHKENLKRLKAWYKEFPYMRIAISNHMLRWINKAWRCGIPSFVLKSYQEMIAAPTGWIWSDEIVIKSKRGFFKVIHGMGYSGQSGNRNAAIDNRCNTIIGHLHSHAGIDFINAGSSNEAIWGMNVGCLISPEKFAFRYGKDLRHKPILGCGVVVNHGTTPIFVAYED